MDQNKVIPAVLAALVAFGGARLMNGDAPKPDVPTPAVVAPSAPSAELQALVAPLRTMAASNRESAMIGAAFYRASADVVGRDTKRIKTMSQFRDARIEANHLYLEKSQYAGTLQIGPTVDNVYATYVGLEDAAIDAAKRKRIVEASEAIAWALEGGT